MPPFQCYRTIRDPECKFPPEAYSQQKEQPPLSSYHVTKEDLGSEDEPLSPNHAMRPRAWLKNRKRQ